MAELNLPEDLVTFLREGRQLEYDPATCEAGGVTLRSLETLKIQLFPMDTQSTEVAEKDPRGGEGGCYLVEAVDLIGACTGDYEPEGLLLWLPRDKRFGTWDSSHTVIRAFGPSVTWSKIVQKPAQHINSQWGDLMPGAVRSSPLSPWRYHTYNEDQVYEVLPLLTEWYDAKWTRRGAFQDGVRLRSAVEVRLRVENGDGIHRITGKRSEMDDDDKYQSTHTESTTLSDGQWGEVQAQLEAGFWQQPERGTPSRGETLTMWKVDGYREKRLRKLFRSYAAGDAAGDPLHSLGLFLAGYLGMEALLAEE